MWGHLAVLKIPWSHPFLKLGGSPPSQYLFHVLSRLMEPWITPAGSPSAGQVEDPGPLTILTGRQEPMWSLWPFQR